ncbi:MAG: translocation/assembly module TamB domain-containing protein [Chlorobiaceae bacterium]
MERIKLHMLRVLTAISAFVLLLSLIAMIVLNSGVLDTLARNRAVSLFNEKLFGRLELQELHLKFPNTVILVNPRIYGPGEKTAVIEARSISLKFNFLSLLQPEIKRLYLRSLEAEALQAKIVREENGKFNIALAFKSRDPDSTKSALEHFSCRTIEVKNSTISYSANLKGPDSLHLELKGIRMTLSSFSAKKRLLRGTLDKLQFTIPRSDFALRQASAKFLFSEERSEILALKAEGNKSRAELSATIDNFNIFSQRSLVTNLPGKSFLAIQDLSLHSNDLRILFPSLALPEGLYSLKGNARGKKDDIEILDLQLAHLKSRIKLKGELMNLQNRNAFAYRIECDSSKIASSLIEPLLHESAYRAAAHNTGDITLLGRAKGTLDALQADMTVRSIVGDLSVTGEVSRGEHEMLASKGSFALKNFKPHKLFSPSIGKSLINATGSFQGKADAKAVGQLTVDINLADSFWQNQPVKEGAVSMSYSAGLMNSRINLKNNPTSLALEGWIDWENKTPRYHASGRMSAVDLSKALGTNEFKTDLNGSFELQGSSFEPGELGISAAMLFSPSSVNAFQLKDRSKATIEIKQNGRSSRASLTSDFIDLLAEGDYTIEKLLALGNLASSGVLREIAAQDIWRTSLPASKSGAPQLREPFKVNYRINVKEIAPLAPFLPVQDLSLKGIIEGHAAYRNGECSISSSIKLARLRIQNSLQTENLAMDAELLCGFGGVPKATASGRASSIVIGEKKVGQSLFSATYTPSRLESSIEVDIPDSQQSLVSKFLVSRNGGSYELLVNRLSMKGSSGIWQAKEGSRVLFDRTSARFNHFSFSKGAQEVVLNGELSNSKAGIFQCTLSGVELNELKRFALDPTLDALSGTINASLSVNGNPGSKTTTLKLDGKSVRYDKLSIGALQGSAVHSGNLLRFELHSSAAGAEKAAAGSVAMNTIDGNGSLPLLLSYYPLHIQVPERQSVNMALRSDNLSAQFLEYLLPFFESAQGTIPTTLRVEGKTPKPDIYLTSRLKGTKIKIEPTQVSYQLDGEIYVTPKAVELRDITIHDNLQGSGKINGVVKLEKLVPGALALEGRFDKLLLFDKKDKKDETSFGSITGSTGNIQVKGTVTAPAVEGELRVNAADFSLYRLGANESAKYVGVNRFIEFVPRYPSKGPVTKTAPQKSSRPADFYYSLLDILQIKNLRLSGIEPLKYTVIFDRLRGEQLETSINNLSLIVNKNNQQYRLFGSVNVAGGKYKFSNSNFDLQDGGRIVWNNVDIRNGVMENLYGGKYVNASNQQTGERDNVKLLLAITGTLNEPQVGMGYYLNEQTQPYASANVIGGKASQVDPNAELNVISMLLSKQWYIRPGGTGQNGNLAVSSVGFSAGTGMISSQLSKVVQDFAGLESFNVNVGIDKRGALSGLDLYMALNVPGTGGKVRFIGTGSAPTMKQSVVQDYYGTGQKIEYRVTPKVYVEAYRSYGQNGTEASAVNLQTPSETWGASLSYRERFRTWDEFWKRIIPSSDKTK